MINFERGKLCRGCTDVKSDYCVFLSSMVDNVHV